MRWDDSAGHVLGVLEQDVMRVLWSSGPLPVREVATGLRRKPALAYTTVMTTLDRLHRKGLLRRHKTGQAFVYEPAMSRDEYRARILERTVNELMSRGSQAEPVLAAFVDAAAKVDEANLSRLEALIAERRRSGK
jgi:predicted transcriptional regulator